MALKYNDEISLIENCPSNNESGDKTLYRFAKLPVNNDSFIPHSVIYKPRFKNKCIAWGLSTYDSLSAAKQAYKNLPKGKRLQLDAIVSGKVRDKDGIKYQSTNNSRHYTFFPEDNLSCVNLFNNVLNNGKE